MITPMIHVTNVAASIAWYQGIGFTLARSHGCEGAELDWAMLHWGEAPVMLSAGGSASDQRRGMDLYIDLDPATHSVDGLYAALQGKAEIVEPPCDAFHGNRELIVRDPDGFWITFAEPVKG